MASDQPFDPWETASGNEPYSQERIYTRSVDKRGFGSTVRLKAPPEVVSEIAKIVAKDWVPEYNTTADFVRDAVIHRLHYWSERISDKQLQRVVTTERRIAMLEHSMREVESNQQMVSTFEEGFKLALAGEDREVFEDLVTHITEAIEIAREPYRGRLRAILARYEEAMNRTNGK